jgi:hypothetical protein
MTSAAKPETTEVLMMRFSTWKIATECSVTIKLALNMKHAYDLIDSAKKWLTDVEHLKNSNS